jgi:hypothetical protein
MREFLKGLDFDEETVDTIMAEHSKMMAKSAEQAAALKEKLKLDADSRVLFFSTEGDTDRESYKAIVWDGKVPSY